MEAILTLCFFLLVIIFVYSMRLMMRRSQKASELISRYLTDAENPLVTEEIFAFCLSDRKLSAVIKKYGATKKDFDILYKKLLLWGNFKKGRRFVPIDSFFYAYTLDYLLRHKEEDAKKLTMKMMNFFHI